MDSLKISYWMLAGLAAGVSGTAVTGAQTGAQTGTGMPAAPAPAAAAQTPAAAHAPAPQAQKPAAPLQLQDMGQTAKADPFPPANPKYFTAALPTVDTVNAFLKALWGYDSNRIWRVEAIQVTPAPNVSKVVVFVSDKAPNSKVQPTAFFVTPDGKHAVAGDVVVPFGATPFADLRKILQARADGATRGSTGKDLMLVEISDMQCPHSKDAHGTMDQLVKDFPNARVVYQSFPLVDLHPFAFKAAAYGYCIQKQKNDAYFIYSASVFHAQAALTPETGDETLKSAVAKAWLGPSAGEGWPGAPAVQDHGKSAHTL